MLRLLPARVWGRDKSRGYKVLCMIVTSITNDTLVEVVCLVRDRLISIPSK